MGLYEDDYEDASAGVIEYYGQPISYNHDELESPESIDATLHPEKQVKRDNDYGWYWERIREAIFSKPEDFEIRLDGVITADSTEYSISQIDDSLPGNRMMLTLKRAEAGEIGRRDYRGR